MFVNVTEDSAGGTTFIKTEAVLSKGDSFGVSKTNSAFRIKPVGLYIIQIKNLHRVTGRYSALLMKNIPLQNGGSFFSEDIIFFKFIL